MQLQTVEASMVHAIGYDEATKTLEVVFTSGKVYQYFEVPESVYEQLLIANEIGSYLRDCVIDCCPYSQLRRR